MPKKKQDDFELDEFAKKSHERFVAELNQTEYPEGTDPQSVQVTGGDLEVIKAEKSDG